MERCLKATGVHLIELPVDYSENSIVLDNEIKKLSKAL